MAYETAVRIGGGGMGEVFRAWDPELRRHVALKYLRSGDPQLVERLQREARAQAKVDHPGVCDVYSVGENDGRPFIAMQYVDGPPLDEAAREMSLEEKVLVVKRIAEAVQAAHAQGLVHRDLKPGNIRVETTQDGEVRPYVLDFGIARLADVEALTVTGQVLGTPGYLSPEQARGGARQEIDRRSDIFSLGVILYELISGELPFSGDSEIDLMLDLIEGEPVPLGHQVPGVPRDLETVVMKCLHQEPGERYSSAQELADELGRFLAGEPVLASPTGPWRVLVRRARRHRFAAGVTVVSALLLVAASVTFAVGWLRYTDRLREERNLAQQKERETLEVVDFLVDLFRVASPDSEPGTSVTARVLLDEAAEKLELDLAGQPLTRATLLHTIGKVYGALGLYDEAARSLEVAEAVRVRELGANDLAVAESVVALAHVRFADRDFPSAESLYRRAQNIVALRLGSAHPRAGVLTSRLASAVRRQGRMEEAMALNAEALAILSEASADEIELDDLLTSLTERASMVAAAGDLERAEELYRDVLSRQEAAFGPADLGRPPVLNNLAIVLSRKGEHEEAERLYRESLAILEERLDETHPDIIRVLPNLASTLAHQEKYAEAEEVLRRRLELQRRSLPSDHWQLGSSLVSGFGRVLMVQEKFDEAEPVLREGVAVFEAALGPDHSWTASARGMLAASLFALGSEVEADRLVKSSVAAFQRVEQLTPDNRYQLIQISEHLAGIGRPELADRYRRLLAESAERSYGTDAQRGR